MSQSIPNCAQNPRKIKQKFIAQHRRAVPSNRAGVLTVQPIRRFPTLEKASVYVSHRTKHNQQERFAIQQTELNAWAVCHVIAGGAA